jgi:hypothetical protein
LVLLLLLLLLLLRLWRERIAHEVAATQSSAKTIGREM